jgi:hypothetical protein
MRVRVTYAGGFDPDQGVGRPEGGQGHLPQAKRPAGLEQSKGFHRPVLTEKILLSIAGAGARLKQLR